MRFARAAGALLVSLTTIAGAGLSAAPASASSWVQYNATLDPGATIFGPGCPQTPMLNYGATGAWLPAGGDNTAQGCTGSSAYILDQPTQTAQWRWHINFCADNVCHIILGGYCKIWIYIPTQAAGDYHARYDFWQDDGNGHLTWLAWPGGTVDQEDNSGWTFIGETPFVNPILTITLSKC